MYPSTRPDQALRTLAPPGLDLAATGTAGGGSEAGVDHKVFWVTGCDVPPPLA
jgi:hypothetical protein